MISLLPTHLSSGLYDWRHQPILRVPCTARSSTIMCVRRRMWGVGIRSYRGVGRPVRLGVLLATGRCSAELPSPLIKSSPAYAATPWESAYQSTKKVHPPIPLGSVAVQGITDGTLHHGETYDVSSLSTRDRSRVLPPQMSLLHSHLG